MKIDLFFFRIEQRTVMRVTGFDSSQEQQRREMRLKPDKPRERGAVIRALSTDDSVKIKQEFLSPSGRRGRRNGKRSESCGYFLPL
jgi:hypothetical protein